MLTCGAQADLCLFGWQVLYPATYEPELSDLNDESPVGLDALAKALQLAGADVCLALHEAGWSALRRLLDAGERDVRSPTSKVMYGSILVPVYHEGCVTKCIMRAASPSAS